MASHVYVKNPNGTTYVYENVSYWDKEDKKTKHRRKCVGKIDPDTKEVIPTGKKQMPSLMAHYKRQSTARSLPPGHPCCWIKRRHKRGCPWFSVPCSERTIRASSHAHITLQAKGRPFVTRSNGHRVANIPAEALRAYRQKDAVEKNFNDLKNDLDMKRLCIHTNATMEGRI